MFEERAGNRQVINRLEKTEKADPVIMEIIVGAIDDGANAPDDLPGIAVAGYEGLYFAVLVKGILRTKTGLLINE